MKHRIRNLDNIYLFFPFSRAKRSQIHSEGVNRYMWKRIDDLLFGSCRDEVMYNDTFLFFVWIMRSPKSALSLEMSNEEESQIETPEPQNDEDSGALVSPEDPEQNETNDENGENAEAHQEEEQAQELLVLSDNEEEDIDLLESLKEELKRKIDELDFEEAAAIQRQIDDLSKGNTTETVQEYLDKLEEQCSQIGRKNIRQRKQLLTKYHNKEVAIRTQYSESFQSLKEKHVRDLKNLENQLFIMYKEKMNKPYATYNELIERAKKTASRAEYEEAKEIQHQAELEKEKERQEREDKFKEVYKAKMNTLLESQKSEIRALGNETQMMVERVEKKRLVKLAKANMLFKKDMSRVYKKFVDAATITKFDARKRNITRVPPELQPTLLNEMEDKYIALQVKYGLLEPELVKKKSLIVSQAPPSSQLPSRLKNRVETREGDRKQKEENERTTSKLGQRYNERIQHNYSSLKDRQIEQANAKAPPNARASSRQGNKSQNGKKSPSPH